MRFRKKTFRVLNLEEGMIHQHDHGWRLHWMRKVFTSHSPVSMSKTIREHIFFTKCRSCHVAPLKQKTEGLPRGARRAKNRIIQTASPGKVIMPLPYGRSHWNIFYFVWLALWGLVYAVFLLVVFLHFDFFLEICWFFGEKRQRAYSLRSPSSLLTVSPLW